MSPKSRAKTPQQKEADKIKRSFTIGWIDHEIREFINRIRQLPCVDKESGGTIFSCAGFGKHASSSNPDDFYVGIDHVTGEEITEHQKAYMDEYGEVYWGYVIIVYDPQFPWEAVHNSVSRFETKRKDPSASHWARRLDKPVFTYDITGETPDKIRRAWETFVSSLESACAVNESTSLNRWQLLAGIR